MLQHIRIFEPLYSPPVCFSRNLEYHFHLIGSQISDIALQVSCLTSEHGLVPPDRLAVHEVGLHLDLRGDRQPHDV